MGVGHVTRDDHRYTLNELGIDSVQDTSGEEKWTITLATNEPVGTGQIQAVFDLTSQQWKLAASRSTHPHRSINLAAERNNSANERPSPSQRRVKWTQVLPRTQFVERFLNEVNWSATSLGPLETWPASLQVCLHSAFADSQAAAVYWGDDLVALYNEEFLGLQVVSERLTGPQDLLGVPFGQVWPELWHDFEHIFKDIASSGKGREVDNIPLFPVKNGKVEETFWVGSFLPVYDDKGLVRGFYNRAHQSTKEVVSGRRANVVNAIAAKPHLTGDLVFKHLIDSCALSEKDFPLAFVYSASEDMEAGKCPLHLQYGYGLPDHGHPLVPHKLELYEGQGGFLPHFRKAKAKDTTLILHTSDGSLPKHLVNGFQWKGFGEPSESIAILPLSTSDRLTGLLVLGLNPRRPFDDEQEGFLNTLLRSVSATVFRAVDREEAQNRAERLSQKLAEHEKSIREMAQYGPVGMARFSPSGKLVWANEQYYDVSGHRREPENQFQLSFLENVMEEDRASTEQVWKTMAHDRRPTSAAIRLKRTWCPPSTPETTEEDKQQNAWLLAAGYPIIEDNELKAIAVSTTDISRFKWAEHVQIKTAAAAKEAKRLQENFIDIVSHEMRNPLSAITQLSDAISGSIEEFENTDKAENDAKRILQKDVEHANTILLCASHQKRIIDDVLTLSKLDSRLLSITPVVVQPYSIIESVLRMFEAEFDANNIKVDSVVEESYKKNDVDWVTLDPSRLTQIFINLITNAVKFTKSEAKRLITVRVGASPIRPPSLANVSWFPTNKLYKDLTLSPEWGKGKPVFVCFEVQDTGRGLAQEEMDKLFSRFQQATEKTHLKYGGSGLGLFISRELTETQGGEIGVRSQRGKGTTFAFYVKGRKAEAPANPKRMVAPKPRKPLKVQNHEAQQQKATQSVDDGNVEKPLSILLCEDNLVNSTILKKQLESANCHVHLAVHGMEALDFLGKTKDWQGMQQEKEAVDLDVILMDQEMPVMDGLTCTRRIRQLQADKKLLRHIPIIATSAHGRQEQIDIALQAGADDVLTKPFRVKECMEKIRRLLDRDSESQHGD